MSSENVELKNAAVRGWASSWEDNTEDNIETFQGSLHPVTGHQMSLSAAGGSR